MKNRISQNVPVSPDYVIKRVRVSKAAKQALVRCSRKTGKSQRDLVAEAFVEHFGTISKAKRTIAEHRSRPIAARALTHFVELRVGKAVAS